MNTITIYIRLLNEGVDGVSRPTMGEVIDKEKGIYKVLPTDPYDPDDEEWMFVPGTIVKCEKTVSIDGKEFLLAIGSQNSAGSFDIKLKANPRSA